MGATQIQKSELAGFLVHYVECRFNFRAAADRTGRHWTTIYRHLDKDPEFREAFNETRRLVGDMAYAEAIRRAIDGVEKPVFGSLGNNQGTGIVGHITEYSDSLLRDILKATRPEFRDRQSVELSGPHGGPVELGDAQLAMKISAILAAAKHRMEHGDVIDAEVVPPTELPAPDDPVPNDLEDLL